MTCKHTLGSPPNCINHGVWPFGRGPTTLLRGLTVHSWGFTRIYPSVLSKNSTILANNKILTSHHDPIYFSAFFLPSPKTYSKKNSKK